MPAPAGRARPTAGELKAAAVPVLAGIGREPGDIAAVLGLAEATVRKHLDSAAGLHRWGTDFGGRS